MATVGVYHEFNTFQLSDGSLVSVTLIDTAGQEKFRALNSQYYRNADGCLLVYDITNMDSFKEIKDYYLRQIKDQCKKNIKIVLLGNKTDLENERKVSSEEGINLAVENGYIFMESSCLKNRTVADSFETLIELTYRENIEKNQNTPNVPENNITISNSKSTTSSGNSGCPC